MAVRGPIGNPGVQFPQSGEKRCLARWRRFRAIVRTRSIRAQARTSNHHSVLEAGAEWHAGGRLLLVRGERVVATCKHARFALQAIEMSSKSRTTESRFVA